MKVEGSSLVYSDDEKIEGVIREQYDRAKEDVERDLRADQKLLQEQLASGDLSPEDYKQRQHGLAARKQQQDETVKQTAKANIAGVEATHNSAFPQFKAQRLRRHDRDEHLRLQPAGDLRAAA